MAGFKAKELMRGHHEFHDGYGPPGRHPFAFRARWGPDRVRDWLDPRKPSFLWQELDGEVRADGLTEAWTPCAGTLHLQYLPDRRIRYDFDFEAGGRTFRYVGDKQNIRLWNLFVSHTTCFGVVTERATGRLVSTGVTLFHLRDLPRLLAVFAGVNAYERILCARERGLYESNYLKANSPDGRRGIWVKHNALVPAEGEGRGEFWIVLFERGEAPIVLKREVPWSEVEADPDAIAIRAGPIALRPDRAVGRIADVSWDLALSGGLPPMFILPYARLYEGPFPKKKGVTPAPNLRFDGEVRVGGERWDLRGWIGLRSHNWGREHAHRYAFGTCNLWDDGAADRAVEGISARIRVAGRLTPWLTLVIGEGPPVARNRLRHWVAPVEVTPGRWRARSRGRHPTELVMTTDPAGYAGLRYAHPDGRESCCYNTKFADVRWTAGGATHTSRCGELEVLYPEPLPGIPLHPTPGWSAADGDYRS